MNPQVVGGLLAGAGNFLGAGIGAIAGGIEGKRNRQHDKDMAALNQQYNLENMAKEQEYNLETMAQQNQYQIDQWNRENEYNDPSAVAARYRAAGINPRAAFGQGSAGGAGIAGGLSSAPSGGSPSGSGPMGSAHPNNAVSQSLSRLDIASGLSAGITAMTNAKRTQAETEGIQIDNRTREVKNLLALEQQRLDLIKTGVETEHERKSIEFIDQQINESRKRIESIDQQIKESGQRITHSNAEISKTEEETRKLRNENTFFETFGFRPGDPVPSAFVSSISKIPEHAKATFSQIKDALSSAPDEVKRSFERFVHRVPIKKGDVGRWYQRFKSSIKDTPFYKNWQKNKKFW